MASGKSLELREIEQAPPIVIDDTEKVAEYFKDGKNKKLDEGYFFAQKWRRNREWRRRR